MQQVHVSTFRDVIKKQKISSCMYVCRNSYVILTHPPTHVGIVKVRSLSKYSLSSKLVLLRSTASNESHLFAICTALQAPRPQFYRSLALPSEQCNCLRSVTLTSLPMIKSQWLRAFNFTNPFKGSPQVPRHSLLPDLAKIPATHTFSTDKILGTFFSHLSFLLPIKFGHNP